MSVTKQVRIVAALKSAAPLPGAASGALKPPRSRSSLSFNITFLLIAVTMSSATSDTVVTPKTTSRWFEECIQSTKNYPVECLMSTNRATLEELERYVARLDAVDETLFMDEGYLAGFDVRYRDFQLESGESMYIITMTKQRIMYDRIG